MKYISKMLLLATLSLGSGCGPNYPFIDAETKIDRFAFNLAISNLPELSGCWQETNELKERRFLWVAKAEDNDDVFSVFSMFHTQQDYGGGSSNGDQGIRHMVGRIYDLTIKDFKQKTTAYYLFDQAENNQFLLIPADKEQTIYALKDATRGQFKQNGKRLTLRPENQEEPYHLLPCLPMVTVDAKSPFTQTLADLYAELMERLQAAAQTHDLQPIDGLTSDLNLVRFRDFALTQPPEQLNHLLGLKYQLLQEKLGEAVQTEIQTDIYQDLTDVLKKYAQRAALELPGIERVPTDAPAELQALHRALQVLLRQTPVLPEEETAASL